MAEGRGMTLRREPRWHAFVATLAAVGLSFALPENLTLVSRFALPVAIGVLTVPLIVSHRSGRHVLNHVFGIIVTSVLTAAVIASIVLLVATLVHGPRRSQSRRCAGAAACGGGALDLEHPRLRAVVLAAGRRRAECARRSGTPHRRGFFFPQMQMAMAMADDEPAPPWSPQFIDYLFLAFNTSTAFSPTDTPVLTRWGKVLMMTQSVISLTVLVLLAARAVNIL